MRLRELIDDAIGNTPRVDASLCVHARIEVASCQRCVDVCPADAWLLDDEQLALDADRCDGCGACVGACPEGALSPPGELRLPAVDDGVVEFACRHRGGESVLACKHALGLRELTRLYRGGMRSLRLHTGDCTGCPSNTAHGLTQRLELFNRVLGQRGLAVVGVDSAGDGERRRSRLDRRRFFARLFDAVGESPGGTGDAMQPAGLNLPTGRVDDARLFAPQLDPERCNGCDACSRVCRHAAIRVVYNPNAYRIEAERCTGCAMCSDVCEQDAISVVAGVSVACGMVPLEARRCRACGARYHRPRPGAAADLCQVCAQANHQRRLYQVL